MSCKLYIAVIRTERIENGLEVITDESVVSLERRAIARVGEIVGTDFEGDLEALRGYEVQDGSDLALDFFDWNGDKF